MASEDDSTKLGDASSHLLLSLFPDNIQAITWFSFSWNWLWGRGDPVQGGSWLLFLALGVLPVSVDQALFGIHHICCQRWNCFGPAL